MKIVVTGGDGFIGGNFVYYYVGKTSGRYDYLSR